MAPTLKEVNAADSAVAETPHGEIAKQASNNAATTAAIHPADAVAYSDNTNEALLANTTNHDNPPEPAPAAAAATATSPAAQAIKHEDPSKIPPDESAFLKPPHFHPQNPFHKHLSSLDLSMRCAICSELFRNPVTLMPCLHNFCSLCVRNHFKTTYTGMKRKANCPQCNEVVKASGSTDYEKGILPNKQLEQQVDIYKLVRDPLRERLVRLDVLEQEKKLGILENCGRGGRKRRNATNEQGGTPKRACTRKEVAKKTNYESSSSEADSDHHDEDYEHYNDASNYKMPSISQAKPQQPQPQQHQLKRKPTTSYHKMNHKKLMQLCQTEGLSTQGKDEELKLRHSGFITLYNSECDSEHPRSVRELVKETKSRESSIKREKNDPDARKQIKLMKNLDKSMGSTGRPTSGNESFDATLNTNFARMIAQVNGRRGTGKEVPTAVDGERHDSPVAAKSHGKDVQESGSDVVHCEPALVNQEAASENHRADTFPQQQLVAGDSEFGRDTNDAGSPTASIDSDKTVETSPQNNDHKQTLSSPPSRSKAAAVAKHRGASSAIKSKLKSNRSTGTGTPSHSRVSILGPWTCQACTFDNMRNVTMRARCELCNTARPIEITGPDGHQQQVAKEVEVVNIDC